MKRPPYFKRALLNLLLFLPVLFQVFLVVGGLTAEIALPLAQSLAPDSAAELSLALVGIPAALCFLVLCLYAGRRTVRATFRTQASVPEAPTPPPPPDYGSFLIRYLPVLLAFGYTLLVSLVALLLPTPTEGAIFGHLASIFTIAHLTSSFCTGFIAMLGPVSPWAFIAPVLILYAAYGIGLAWGFQEQGIPATRFSGRRNAAAAFLVVLGVIIARTEFMSRDVLRGKAGVWYAEKNFTDRYHPFEPDNRLVKIADPTLTIDRDHPRLDGATAAYPVYAAAVQAIYKNFHGSTRSLVTSSTTPQAYDRLISGEADLIFVAQPSPGQRAAAEAAGHPLQLTPIAKEAFVFFVHADNPVEGLTSAQIRAIYTKKITNWSQVGGRDEKILPFQRPAGSGSQTALELKVMKGEKPSPPLREEFAEGMGGVIQRVAAFQSSSAALGYSFRVFATTMNLEKNIRLLAIDGVKPTRETIRSGTYPYTVQVFAATAGTTNVHVPALLAWFLGPQGQRLIDETGYVSLEPVP